MQGLKCIEMRIIRNCFSLTLFVFTVSIAPAQQSPVSSTSQGITGTASSTRSADDRIGPGDVLDVRVFNKSQFSTRWCAR